MAARPEHPRGNLVALAAARGVRFAASFGVQVVLAVLLDLEGFGVYGFVVSASVLFAFGTTLGLPLLLTPRIAREPSRVLGLVGPALRAVAGLSLLTGAALVAYAWLADGRPHVVLCAALAALGLGLNGANDVLDATFQGLRTMRRQVPGALVGRVVYVVATVGLLLGGLGIVGVFAAIPLGAAAHLVVSVHLLRHQVGALRTGAELERVGTLLQEAVPYGLNLFLGAVYLQADVQLLKWFRGDGEVGLYRAAALVVIHAPILAQVLNAGLYPRISRLVGQPARVGAELSTSTRLLLAISVPMAVGGLCMPADLLVLLGEDFRPAALAFAILLPLLPLRFVNNGLGMALSALDRQRWRTRAVLAAAVLNVAANLWAIPRYGAAGAATTTVATEILLGALLAIWLRPTVRGLRAGSSLARALVPAAVMAAVVLAASGWPVGVRVALGGVVYLPLAGLTRAWRAEDLHVLRRI